MQRSNGSHHLTSGGTSVVVDLPAEGLPAILHWGPEQHDADVRDVVRAERRQRVSGGLDAPQAPSILPLPSEGWLGSPGLAGARATGRDFSPLFRIDAVEGDRRSLTVRASDPEALLALVLELRLSPSGVLRVAAELRNDGEDDYRVDRLEPRLPVPADATELLHAYGRHLRERSPQRQPFTVGSTVREARGGRPGAGSPLLMLAGRSGFGFERGLVHGVHAAWSGSTRWSAERSVTGDRSLSAAALLEQGEVVLGPGGTYRTPDLVASWGDGLTELSARIHAELRARPSHPTRPRPVTLNTWEAVYFDHDLDRLTRLADRAAEAGVERYVLDDGWFTGRRDDTSSLGDWSVDPEVWPAGLSPIVDHVTGLGMEFGLWFEPEMVNPDSELARAHPEWILAPEHRLAPSARSQQVLNIAHPDAWQYLLERISALLSAHDIAYIKWDHNRDLIEPTDRTTGRPAARENVLALYRLLDALRERHPGVEIESCASGGARIDLGILERTDRVWTSDCIDPVERLDIQKYTSLLLPPELMGMHIGSERAHSTGRRTELDLRAGIALPGHLGIEWDLTAIDDEALTGLRDWVGFHKDHRAMLHTGTLVHADLPDESADLRGVVATDRSAALYTYTAVTSTPSYPPERITLPGLDPSRRYRVRIRWGATATTGQSALPWAEDGLELSGRALLTAGVRPPVLHPQHLVVLEVTDAGVQTIEENTE